MGPEPFFIPGPVLLRRRIQPRILFRCRRKNFDRFRKNHPPRQLRRLLRISGADSTIGIIKLYLLYLLCLVYLLCLLYLHLLHTTLDGGRAGAGLEPGCFLAVAGGDRNVLPIVKIAFVY